LLCSREPRQHIYRDHCSELYREVALSLIFSQLVDRFHHIVVENVDFGLVHCGEALDYVVANSMDVLLLKSFDILQESLYGGTRCKHFPRRFIYQEICEPYSKDFIEEVHAGQGVVNKHIAAHYFVYEVLFH
jgi:hypothetical protein